MAQVTQASPHRPSVLAFASIAAALGIYYLYSTYSDRPVHSSLRRSNAVHHGRFAFKPEITAPNAESPLGTLVLRRGNHVLRHELVSGEVPTKDAVREAVGDFPDRLYPEVVRAAVYGMVFNCTQLSTPEMRNRIATTVFRGIPELLESHYEDPENVSIGLMAQRLAHINASIVDPAIISIIRDRADEVWEEFAWRPSDVEVAETEEEVTNGPQDQQDSQGIKGLLYYIAEDVATKKACEHHGVNCDECGQTPILGVRYHCLNCPDWDLCETCESMTGHAKTHVLAKIKTPLPVLANLCYQQHQSWYPGDLHLVHHPLAPSFIKSMSQRYGFEEPSIRVLYDQFVCTANSSFPRDFTGVGVAIDRRAFNEALTPVHWAERHAPNVLYDRMFAFYDADGNGLIDFDEFVNSISYLRGPRRYDSMRPALTGFDLDGDGLVDRSDFLRLFRAKYHLQQKLISELIDSQEQERTMAAMDTLRSSQPISSIFHQDEIPRGEVRPSGGKQLDAFGDMQPLPGTKTILDDDEPWPSSQPHMSSRERLEHHLSRFDELLYGSPSSNLASDTQAQLESSPDLGAATANRSEPLDSEQANAPSTYTKPHPEISRDAILQVVEAGLNDMLDPMFKAKEDAHHEAISTRTERKKWRAEIDKMLKEKRDFEEHLHSAAEVDPLLATALQSYASVDVKLKLEEEETPAPAFRAQLVPTDTDNLARREAEIAEKPLEELLEVAGYGTVDTGGEALKTTDASSTEGSGAAATSGVRSDRIRWSRPLSDSSWEVVDPTMPQNKPESVSQPCAPDFHKAPESGFRPNYAQAPEPTPSKQRLEQLAILDKVDEEIAARGGPGRLSFDEVESMVLADTTKELRGLVISWLEWASF